MLSRSAVAKLKAILVIDLIVVAAAAGTYLFLLNQGTITAGAKPATFTISDFTVTPQEAYIGDTVQISANITNTGDVDGNTTFNLQINGAVKTSENVTLAAGASQLLEFSDSEMAAGNYTVTLGEQVNSQSSYFVIKNPPPDASKIVLTDFLATPYEAWPDRPVNITFTARNPNSTAPDHTFLRVTVDGATVASQLLELNASESRSLFFVVNATTEGKHNVAINGLKGTFMVVKEGCHTLIINRSGGGSKALPFTLNGQTYNTPYQAVLPEGEYSVSVPSTFDVGTGVLAFTSWSTGSTSPSLSFNLNDKMILVVTYTVISGYASCPSLYIWNGTGYSYITDVSNPGWLGYIGHMDSNGAITRTGGNPYDYVKLPQGLLAANNGYYDVTLSQQWDELFYLDQAQLLAVDHPAGTDVYSTLTNYLNQGSTGQLYTVSNGTLLSPVSAVNEKNQSVLSDILTRDGVFTPGSNGYQSQNWSNPDLNQLTLDLGNLSGAPQIKLVMTAMVDWGPANYYYQWINQFTTAAAQGLVPDGTPINPPPNMQIMDANGNWVSVPQDRQMPVPSDYNARTFTVDLTGLFPAGISDYKVRFTNFWNVTYDYIGIDTTPQANITVQKITPTTATLSQWTDTQSNSSGAFTRYGDVTPLVQDADNMFVIGRQGDKVEMQFSTANLTAPAPGMIRDYIFVVACWFKDPPGAWGYGFNFTTDPMPFLGMSGFPYPASESYPYDAAHLAYIQEYNTRIIN